MYSRANDRIKAEAILRERLQKDPASPVAVQNMANYLAATNRFVEGEAVIKGVLNDKRPFPEGHQMVGDFYFRNRKLDQALTQYEAVFTMAARTPPNINSEL